MGLNYTNLTNLNVDSLAIGGAAVTATAAELNKMDGVTATAAEINRGALKVKTGALAAVDTGGGVFSVALTSDSLVEYIQVIVSTETTDACTIDCGVTGTSATTKVDNLIDGKDINAATGTFDNIADAGSNGKYKYLCPAGKWVTGSVASGDSAGLVGTYKIYYREL